MPDTLQNFLTDFTRRWEENERRSRDALAACDVAQLERRKFIRYGLLREVAIRLSKLSVCGAGTHDAKIDELIRASRVIAQSEAIPTSPALERD